MLSGPKTTGARKNSCAVPALVITCEHGGNRIPGLFIELFKTHQALLSSHRGFDPGALIMAKDLATAFDSPLVISTVSRLLVDLNRSIGHTSLYYETVRKQPPEIKSSILKLYYQPYRAQAENLVRQAINDYGQVIHLSSHSFTPELDGKVRTADIGLLYDPARPNESIMCKQWKKAFNEHEPGLVIRRNYPYAGKNDGLTSWFRKQFPADSYLGIELEINHKHVNKSEKWPALRKTIIHSLRIALSNADLKNTTKEICPL